MGRVSEAADISEHGSSRGATTFVSKCSQNQALQKSSNGEKQSPVYLGLIIKLSWWTAGHVPGPTDKDQFAENDLSKDCGLIAKLVSLGKQDDVWQSQVARQEQRWGNLLGLGADKKINSG